VHVTFVLLTQNALSPFVCGKSDNDESYHIDRLPPEEKVDQETVIQRDGFTAIGLYGEMLVLETPNAYFGSPNQA